MSAKFELFKDAAGQFRFHMKANGEVIAASQGSTSKRRRKTALRRSTTMPQPLPPKI